MRGIIYNDTYMKPTKLLPQFDLFLEKGGLTFDAVIIGGAALSLLGVISRETQDCDVLDPKIPEEIQKAAEAFAKQIRKQGGDLREDWLNHGPEELGKVLPREWKLRLVKLYSGKAIEFQTLGRDDLLKSKLFALCDRGQDLADCLAMKPTREVLLESLPWLKQQDTNPHWPDHVKDSIQNLAKKLGYGL